MIRGLQFFKATFFSQEPWCTQPWGRKPKDFSQQLYDIGLLVPTLLEELKTIRRLPNPNQLSQAARIWQTCQNLDDRLNVWHARLLDLFPNSLYWEQPVVLIDRAADIPPSPFATSLRFLNIRIADCLAVFWSLRIILCTIMWNLGVSRGAKVSEHDPVIVDCARNIGMSVSYFMQPETGYLGIQWIIFPLKMAMTAFQQLGWKNEWQWGRDVLQALPNRGVRYGGDIAEVQWGEKIR